METRFLEATAKLFSLSFQVQLWLEQQFAGEGYPQYELKPRTVQILHQLMQKNQAENRDALLIIDDLTQKAEEYKAEGEILRC